MDPTRARRLLLDTGCVIREAKIGSEYQCTVESNGEGASARASDPDSALLAAIRELLPTRLARRLAGMDEEIEETSPEPAVTAPVEEPARGGAESAPMGRRP